ESEGTLTFTDSIIENTVLAGGIASTGVLEFAHSGIHGIYLHTNALSLGGTATVLDSIFAAGESIAVAGADITLTSVTLADSIGITGSAHIHDGGGNAAPIILAWQGELDADTTFPGLPFVNTLSNVSVPSGVALTVAPGAVAKSYDPLDVSGTLVVGAPGSPAAILTSAADDSAGGDTNPGDGDSSPTDPDYAFAGILAEEGSTVTITNTEIRYAGEAYGSYLPTPCAGDPDAPQDACAAQVSNFGGTLTVASSTFNRATYNDFLIDDGTTVITGSRFSDSPRFALVRGGTFSASGNSITDTTGVLNESGAAMDARNNWWGTASGPHEAVSNPGGTGPEVSGGVLYNPWLATDPFAPVATPDGVSNVLFLPGTEASRLYYRDGLGIEHQVWEPNFRTDIPYLAMNTDGSSTYPLYTKDIIERMTANSLFESSITRIFGSNLEVYKGFQGYMDTLVADGTIEEWRAYPYDWRYDVRDVVEQGTPTWVPGEGVRQVYLADVLRQMASSSASGKVTIVAHSNGGLLAKALASSLGGDASRYIDRIVLVGTPQWGTPEAIGAMLHSDNFASMPSLVINSVGARTVMRDMPNPYELLPSDTYFTQIADPVITFNPSGALTGPFATAYGESITSSTALESFLTDSAGLDSSTGSASDITALIPLSSPLLAKARTTQALLEAWEPPPDISVTAIAGWGQDTAKALAYTTGSRAVCTRTALIFTMCTSTPELKHTPVTTQDGDGTVVSPSAIGEIGEHLYFNATEFENQGFGKIIHRNLTSAGPITNLIKELLANEQPPITDFIKDVLPTGGTGPITRISTHSPVNLVVTDASGQESGVLPIPGSDFSGVKQDIIGSSVHVLGSEQYVSVPQSGSYRVVTTGYESGSATLQVETIGNDGAATAVVTYASVPTSAGSTATFTLADDTSTAPIVDVNGDGTPDFTALAVTPATTPLEYLHYIQAVVSAMSLDARVARQLRAKLANLEHLLKKDGKWEAEDDDGPDNKRDRLDARIAKKLDKLVAYITRQAALAQKGNKKNPPQGIPAASAELILDMITELKALTL
ncbi:MAG TPA: hypothetical protein VJK73_01700, partial [Candidatus Paceibacterota bacterium]